MCLLFGCVSVPFCVRDFCLTFLRFFPSIGLSEISSRPFLHGLTVCRFLSGKHTITSSKIPESSLVAAQPFPHESNKELSARIAALFPTRSTLAPWEETIRAIVLQPAFQRTSLPPNQPIGILGPSDSDSCLKTPPKQQTIHHHPPTATTITTPEQSQVDATLIIVSSCRTILVENPCHYQPWASKSLPPPEFTALPFPSPQSLQRPNNHQQRK